MRTGTAPPVSISTAPRTLRGTPAGLVFVMTAACLTACSGGRALPAVEPKPAVADSSGISVQGQPPSATHAPSDSTATAPAPPRRMMPGRVYAPTRGEVACPSLDFEEFIRAFFNSGDLQVRYTARPVRYKVPYYDYHNTEPGDPANPRWETYERDRPMHDRFRYDAQLRAYISDSSRLRAGQQWTGIGEDGKHVPHPMTELALRKVSDGEWQVVTPGRITTFSRRPDCWYATGDWSLDPFEGCKWPEECRAWREHEGHEQEGD